MATIDCRRPLGRWSASGSLASVSWWQPCRVSFTIVMACRKYEISVKGTQNLDTKSVHHMDALVYEAHCVQCVHHLIEYLAVDRAHWTPSYVHLHQFLG